MLNAGNPTANNCVNSAVIVQNKRNRNRRNYLWISVRSVRRLRGFLGKPAVHSIDEQIDAKSGESDSKPWSCVPYVVSEHWMLPPLVPPLEKLTRAVQLPTHFLTHTKLQRIPANPEAPTRPSQ